eukprot:4016923-Pyramimonas_sp.AAC.1
MAPHPTTSSCRLRVVWPVTEISADAIHIWKFSGQCFGGACRFWADWEAQRGPKPSLRRTAPTPKLWARTR